MPFCSSYSSPTVVSRCTVVPEQKSSMGDLRLSISDLPMLSCHYIQKGCLYTRPPLEVDELVALLKRHLSQALTLFPPLAGRLITDSAGYVYITCNDAGALFIHANSTANRVRDVLVPGDVPEFVEEFFAFDRTVSYTGHSNPIMAVQVTALADGVFIGISVNHAVTDGTSFWNFFNTYAELCRSSGSRKISPTPDFTRDSVLISTAVLKFPAGGPKVTFSVDAPLRERIFSFSRESILKLKALVNNRRFSSDGAINAEILGKQSNDTWKAPEKTVTKLLGNLFKNPLSTKPQSPAEISSFQSLCALLWRGVTRARRFPDSKMTTFRMAVNCRHRLAPKLDPFYFGNAIQSIPTYALAGKVTSRDLQWCAQQLNIAVNAHDADAILSVVEDWESDPRCFPLGNFDGAMITMGSSPRFPMYENDLGWGRPVAVRSGRANKFDGKISAFPGRDGGGSVDLEVCLSPETMTALENDSEFMQYVSV
ncbi:uncharacterized acetyltransferase At3g50280 [Malania oleifera]|uniref:uncharacterized acetyltransferase At3g50280 n=1 Tax=Malania oleifera TaxID=397392 RepID=UPI0025AEC239|nr:uncharacterized acetyltransferase At3g50280 [Malania oleifera]